MTRGHGCESISREDHMRASTLEEESWVCWGCQAEVVEREKMRISDRQPAVLISEM